MHGHGKFPALTRHLRGASLVSRPLLAATEPAAEQEQEIPEEEMPSAGPSPGPEPAPGTAVTPQLQEAEPLKAPEPLVFAAGGPTDPGTQPLALLTAPGTERPPAL